MTEQEMYREIMSRYALNPEKIRVNALKQAKKPAWQRFASDYWKPAAGIAAAVALTVSAVGYMNSNSPRPDIDITVDQASALSAARRLSEAEQNYFNLQSLENKNVNIYVTFREPVSCCDAVMTLSGVADAGEIEIVSVYLDSETLTGTEAVAEYMSAHGEEKIVLAVKISTLSMYYRSIQDLSAVYLAEIGSDEINDDTFSPIIVEDNDPLVNDRFTETTTAVTAAPVTTTSFSFDSGTSATKPENVPSLGDSADASQNTLKPPQDTDEDDPEEENPEEDDEEEYDDPEEIDELETTSPAETEDVTTSQAAETESTESTVTSETAETTTSQATEAIEIPSNEITGEAYQSSSMGLLTEFYELKIENSTETVISGDNAVVLTKNGVYLYTLGLLLGEQGGVSVELGNPKIAFKNDNTIVLTGCSASGARNLISVVSLEDNTLRTYDVSANIGAAELGTINYSTAQNKYFIKTVSETSSFIYEVQISDESGIIFRPLVESQNPVAAVGFKDNLLYLSMSDALSGTKLYSFNTIDGETREVAAFTENMKIKRGEDFESFALLSDSSKFIYDLNRGMAVSTELLSEDVKLMSCNGKTCFKVGDVTYEITENSSIEQMYGSDVFPMEQMSEYKVNEITPEKVVIVRDNGGNMWR